MKKLVVSNIFLATACATGEKMDSADKEALRSAIKSHSPEVKECYEKYLEKGKKEGLVTLQFKYFDQKISGAEIVKSEINDETLHKCITNQALTWQMPKYHTNKSVVVVFPYLFKAEENKTVK
ncbi:MAG: hypothetical protein A4S09_04310 [Proteobacteria bacterium SG_bin7]|nr:MAG: hypothetical protein A4S09_04310 [Proteobacteria bacterium SG_bin7]